MSRRRRPSVATSILVATVALALLAVVHVADAAVLGVASPRLRIEPARWGATAVGSDEVFYELLIENRGRFDVELAGDPPEVDGLTPLEVTFEPPSPGGRLHPGERVRVRYAYRLTTCDLADHGEGPAIEVRLWAGTHRTAHGPATFVGPPDDPGWLWSVTRKACAWGIGT